MQNKFKIVLSLLFTVLFIFLFSCDKSNPVDNTGGTVTDADGNVYTTVIIGNQEWTKENLRTTKYNDGSDIPHVTDSAQWAKLFTPGYCFYNNTTDAGKQEKYGVLYSGYTMETGKLAPTGWHVPTGVEWSTLQNYLIANDYNWDGTTIGNKIGKSMAAKTDWSSSGDEGDVGNNLSTNNSSGFSALPGGYRNYNGDFDDKSINGHWWSATGSATNILYYYLSYDNDSLSRDINYKNYGFSVRIVRDVYY